MDTEPEKKIEELEAQVQDLTSLVQQLLAEKLAQQASVVPENAAAPVSEADAAPADTVKPAPITAPKTARKDAQPKKAPVRSGKSPDMVQNMRRRVDQALRGNPTESFETRIGVVWLSRLAVVVAMTAIALAARTTIKADTIGPWEIAAWHKVLVGYALAGAFIGYGFFFRRSTDLFAQAILGCGLAGLYFTTYAALFIPQMRVFTALDAGLPLFLIGLPLLLLSLIFLVSIAHQRRSPTVAGIGLFLAYYTVALSCYREPNIGNLTHALLTCTALAIVTLVFHSAHRWLLFSWGALIATHVTYIYIFFFLNHVDNLGMPPKAYFWLSNGFLTVCYILFSLTCIIDARKQGEYRRTVAPMAGVNSFVFFTLTWFSIRANYPEYEWMFRAGFAALLLVFAIFAETTGPRRNYLFQIFIAKTVIMITLALQAYLSGEKMLVAMAIECLALGFSYRRSGIVVFKVLGMLLLCITFFASMVSVKMIGHLTFLNSAIPANWFSAVGVAFVFQIVAWFYEKFVRRLRPEYRTVSGQWFLADSPLDFHNASIAIAHAAAGALILLTITIFELSNDVRLPFILAFEAASLAVLGLILFTPQIEVASVLLLAAAHVCYYVFLWLPPVPGFDMQQNFVWYTGALVFFTFVGAYAWERYLKRYRQDESEFEHMLVASVPYLAATFMLFTLMARELAPLHVPSAMGAVGLSLLLVGSLLRFTAVKASGVLSMALASGNFYSQMYNADAPLAHEPEFLFYLCLFLSTFAGAERLFVILERFEVRPPRVEEGLRTVLVVLALVLGVLGLYEWSSPNDLVFYLLGLAVSAISIGALFRESRYRWGGLALFVLVLVRAFTRFGDLTSEVHQILTFGIPAVVLLVVSWAYSRGRFSKERESQLPEDGRPAVPRDEQP